jgi:hypothetical protein
MKKLRSAIACVAVSIGLSFPGCVCSKSDDAKPQANADAASIAPFAMPRAEPVFPMDGGPPEPLAVKFCDAALKHGVDRRQECCKEPSRPSSSGQCIRTLSVALRDKAVTIDPADIDRCVEAVTKQFEGCDWVGPSNTPVPAACRGILKGALAEGASCRSSLECKAGQFCDGLRATRRGVCTAARPPNSRCGGIVDTLVAYTSQGLDRSHGECAEGTCLRGACQGFIVAGGACTASMQCGPAHTCVDGKCSDAPLPDTGQPCAGKECRDGLRCIEGKCREPKKTGESCSSDFDCRAACVRPDGGSAGRCQMSCATRARPALRSRVEPLMR